MANLNQNQPWLWHGGAHLATVDGMQAELQHLRFGSSATCDLCPLDSGRAGRGARCESLSRLHES